MIKHLITLLLCVLSSISISAQSYAGTLTHTGGYFSLKPYNESYDDGSAARLYYDGHKKSLLYWNSNPNLKFTNIEVGNIIAHKSLSILNGGQRINLATGTSTSGYVLDVGLNDDGVNFESSSPIRGFNFRNGRGSLLTLSQTGNLGVRTENPKSGLSLGNLGQSLLNMDWTYETDWNGNSNKWAGFIGFNAYRNNNHAKDYYYRSNDYTKRMVFEGGNNGFRWLGESDVPNRGVSTGLRKLPLLMKLSSNGNVLLNGKLEAKEIKVTTTPTADFVFEEDYKIPSLETVEVFIKLYKHLPEIASAEEMEKNGVNIGEFQIKLLQKIEELTLYTIRQEKKLKEFETLESKYAMLQKKMTSLEQLINRLLEKENQKP